MGSEDSIKIPNSIMICGQKFTVKKDKNYQGGHFCDTDKEIIVGTGFGPSIAKEIFLHEVIESILAIRGMRYRKYADNCQDNSSYMFAFNHTEFENSIKDIVCALSSVKL